ncbi:MAG TPA: response regulator [Gemmatimonadales bacterium]
MPNSILLVDDDDDSREFLGELLQGRGFDVHLAQHGREALSMLHDLPRPCTVLLDLNMPQVSGEAVLRTLAETGTADAFPVIVVSGDDKVIGVPYPNIVARLSKPFELGVLERALAKVARGHDAPGMTPTAIPLVDDGRAHSAVFRFR